jgi:hypothetical protein
MVSDNFFVQYGGACFYSESFSSGRQDTSLGGGHLINAQFHVQVCKRAGDALKGNQEVQGHPPEA